MDTEKEQEYTRLLYIAGALETYFQFREVAEEQDAEDVMALRKRIQPLVQELRAIRNKAAGLPTRPKNRGTR